MEFKNRVKNRRLKRHVSNIINIFKLRALNLQTSWKIILFWIVSNFISLFFPWVDYIDWESTKNAFSSVVWNIWIILVLVLFFLLFNLFSINSKEKIKMHIGIHFKDYPVSILLWLFIIILWIVSFNFINALQFFSSTIIYWSWIIFSISSWVMIFVWWIMQRSEFNDYSNKSDLIDFESNLNDEENRQVNNKNMKLPF